MELRIEQEDRFLPLGWGKSWAGLLEVWGSGTFPGSVYRNGSGNDDPGPRLPGGCP